MRHIKKRVTVANDGFCNFKKSADERIMEKADKYITEMEKKGWTLQAPILTGDSFSRKEAIINMYK